MWTPSLLGPKCQLDHCPVVLLWLILPSKEGRGPIKIPLWWSCVRTLARQILCWTPDVGGLISRLSFPGLRCDFRTAALTHWVWINTREWLLREPKFNPLHMEGMTLWKVFQVSSFEQMENTPQIKCGLQRHNCVWSNWSKDGLHWHYIL